MNDEEFDDYLVRQLDEPPLRDQEFTVVVMARIEGDRRRRRVAFVIAVAVAAGLATFALGPGPKLVAISAGMVIGMMFLTALCGLVWIDTESRTAPDAVP